MNPLCLLIKPVFDLLFTLYKLCVNFLLNFRELSISLLRELLGFFFVFLADFDFNVEFLFDLGRLFEFEFHVRVNAIF